MTMNISAAVTARQQTIANHWNAFLQTGSPLRIAEVIKRKDAKLPKDFVPWAPGIVIVSDYLLWQAGYHPHNGPVVQLPGWRKHRWSFSKEVAIGVDLIVRRRSNFFVVEVDHVLAFSFGSMPIATRTPEPAKYLAEYCYSNYTVWGMRWVSLRPDGILWC
jgi:hypothetical protein